MANPYLVGNYAPVTEELTVEVPLPVEGVLPPALEGLVVRNGPNPAGPVDPDGYHWFSGDGMVHAVELRQGWAVSYRNRWVRTRKLAEELDTAPPAGPSEPIDGPANTHVLWHGGRLLALVESGFPHRLGVDLSTKCVEDFDGMLSSPFTAHPHVDPDTGGMAAFGYDVFGPPFLRYHELDAQGSIVHSTQVPVPRATMQHDFGVTATNVAFLDLPVVFDRDLALGGRTLPFEWDPGAGARVGVLERGAGGEATRWVGVDPCYVFHVVNAFDGAAGRRAGPRHARGGAAPSGGATVVLDVVRYDTMFDLPPGQLLSSSLPRLERWLVDPAAATVERTPLDDRTVEFPRIDDHLAGRPYRYAYCCELRRHDGQVDDFEGLVRYDLVRDESASWHPGPGRHATEPVFVRDPEGRADDEGWVLCLVYDEGRQASDLVVLDASAFGKDPEAVVHLPARVPYGFHGSWIPAEQYR